jgi:leucyl/phenylalanyl-tRNA--protein transferase
VKRPAPPRLDADLLLRAYGAGFFPMAASKRGPLSWFSPDPRTIIPLESFNVPRSLSRVIRENHFEIRVNGAFDAVIHGCADREDTWISREIIEATTELHRRGFAHSVESWQAEELAGGLYGVAIGGAFFGESMFSRTPNASKAALVALVERLRTRGFRLLDVQYSNPHLAQFGAAEISRENYLDLLARALALPAVFFP